MPKRKTVASPVLLAVLGVAGALVVAGLIAFAGSLVLAAVLGVLLATAGLWLALRRRDQETDPSRRRFLLGVGAAGIGAVAGGAAVGRTLERLTRPDPAPVMARMARSIGSEGMEYMRRGVYPGRSGDLQLVLAPFNTSNYPQESVALSRNDPRSSHAMLWGYTERVPIVLYGPGFVGPASDSTERVTLADLAPTTATLMGFDGFDAPDGRTLPGIARPSKRPKIVVTFVIDGGGWNVLTHWPTAWPNLRRLMKEGLLYRDAVMGSFPSVTASAHATIGTGAFPRTHGINGHNMRRGGHIVKAWGTEGQADPSFLLSPTLAEHWNKETGNRSWVGEIGYQIWHIGMIGRGGRNPLGRKPVAMYWDEETTDQWQPQNPELFRLPDGTPPREELTNKILSYFKPARAAKIIRQGGKKVCCSPPIIQYQGDVIANALAQEPIGTDDVTDLLYVNYKMPDYTGHVYNMLSYQERIALRAVDNEIGRLRGILEQRFPGEFVLIVTADHGQCPLVDTSGGVRLDPIQLQKDIDRAFGRSLWPLVQEVFPSEVYLDSTAMWDAGVTRDEIAAFLSNYRYGENIGPYVAGDAVDSGRQARLEFTGVFPAPYLAGLGAQAIAALGPGSHGDADPGIPELPQLPRPAAGSN